MCAGESVYCVGVCRGECILCREYSGMCVGEFVYWWVCGYMCVMQPSLCRASEGQGRAKERGGSQGEG